MPKFMVHYSVQEEPNKVINSDLLQSLVIEANIEKDAKEKLHEVETRKINYISSVSLFSWYGRN
jgi:DNA-dependent RNA polymerase auxiliary subunit epsilon